MFHHQRVVIHTRMDRHGLRSLDDELAAADLVRRLGARITGWGAFTRVVGQAGLKLAHKKSALKETPDARPFLSARSQGSVPAMRPMPALGLTSRKRATKKQLRREEGLAFIALQGSLFTLHLHWQKN